jgi:hypothetical protein
MDQRFAMGYLIQSSFNTSSSSRLLVIKFKLAEIIKIVRGNSNANPELELDSVAINAES